MRSIETEKGLIQVDGNATRRVGEPLNAADPSDSAGRRRIVAFLEVLLGKTQSKDKPLAGLRMFVTTRTGESDTEAGNIRYRPIFQNVGTLTEPDHPSVRVSFVLTSLVQLETPLCVCGC